MENKINVAELLKNCPNGMELDSPMYDNLYFDCVEMPKEMTYPIKCYIDKGVKTSVRFNKYGQFTYDSKCVIFPKGATTWEGFRISFKDGDIVSTEDGAWIGITQGGKNKRFIPTYCVLTGNGEFEAYFDEKENWCFYKLATEEEKAKLFQAIKANGYKWNAETKTLEKLIEPKFKVGDIIEDVDEYKVKITEVNVEDECYAYESMIAKGIGGIDFKEQDNWELVPNKFDIRILRPFESKVLVRDDENWFWKPAIYGFYDITHFYVVGGNAYKQCIPYESNRHLLGTKDDCDEFYKTWK